MKHKNITLIDEIDAVDNTNLAGNDAIMTRDRT